MNKLKKYLPYLLNSVIIISLFLLILLLSKTAPFGNVLSIGTSDAIYQYKPMLYNFIMRLKTGTLLQYTFNNGLGNSFFFNFAYYLTSPLNLIACFFKNPDSMFLSVILIKIFFTVIFCTFYAKKKGCSNLISFIVSLSYVFSSWFMVYYFNIMWLDTFMIFPLFQYSLEKLTNENKIVLFILCLAYTYATNFYIAFSVLVYSIVYFIIKNFFYKKDNIKLKLKTFGLFLFSMIFSILIIAFYINMLFVVKKQMGLGFSDSTSSPYILTTLNFIKSLYYGNNVLTMGFSGSTFPNIAMNTIIMLSVIFYFLNSKIKARDKAFAFIALTLIIDCLFSPKLDYIMHFFHYVYGLTYRYTFIFSFLAIMLFIKNVKNFDKKDLKKLIPLIIGLLIIALLIGSRMELKVLIFNIISLLIVLFMIIFYRDNNIYKYLVTFFVVLQSLVVGYWTIPSDMKFDMEKNRGEFIKDMYTYRLNTIGEGDYMNKNMYTNEDVTYLFSSMTYNDVIDTVNYLGYDSGVSRISGNFHNDLFSLIFNVKNENYLEKIYSVNKDIKDIKFSENKVKENTEDLIYKMTGIKGLYKEVIIDPVKEDDLYKYYKVSDYYLVKIGEYTYPSLGDSFKISKDASDYQIYKLDENTLQNIYDYLKEEQIEYTTYRDDLIEGNINVSDGKLIFTSIPYDEYWQISIDGKRVKSIKLLGSLIGIEVSPGKHNIKMEYKCDFTKSIIISIVSLFTLIICTVCKRIINSKKVAKIKISQIEKHCKK